MSLSAPIDVNPPQHESTKSGDDIVLLDDPMTTPVVSAPVVIRRDPAMILVYLGVLSLIAIITISAVLAF